jgi:hypothetical protein
LEPIIVLAIAVANFFFGSEAVTGQVAGSIKDLLGDRGKPAAEAPPRRKPGSAHLGGLTWNVWSLDRFVLNELAFSKGADDARAMLARKRRRPGRYRT